jgi:porphobilinogen synthase
MHIETLLRRPRRNRHTIAIRELVQETHLRTQQLIQPLFVQEGNKLKTPISSLPDNYRLSIDECVKEAEELLSLGVQCVNLFCYTPHEQKDLNATAATEKNNLLQRSIAALKKAHPELCVMADIALDPFTTHGHDGLVDETGYVVNDPTITVLQEMSLRAAEAGCDIVSPSDMMDGRIKAIRQALDKQGFHNTGILSYAAKYASGFYGPFRDALDSSPQFGDKKSYQMNPANWREALLECQLDEEEGADLLLIKPALSNLDIIAKVRNQTNLPLGAYQVSGEWAMIKAAGRNGWIDETRVLLETLLCIRRAGADFIFTYGAKQAARALNPTGS